MTKLLFALFLSLIITITTAFYGDIATGYASAFPNPYYSGIPGYYGGITPGFAASTINPFACNSAIANANRAFYQLIFNLRTQGPYWMVYSAFNAVDQLRYTLKYSCKLEDIQIVNLGGPEKTEVADKACGSLLGLIVTILEQGGVTNYMTGFQAGTEIAMAGLNLAKDLGDQCNIRMIQAPLPATNTQPEVSPITPPLPSGNVVSSQMVGVTLFLELSDDEGEYNGEEFDMEEGTVLFVDVDESSDNEEELGEGWLVEEWDNEGVNGESMMAFISF